MLAHTLWEKMRTRGVVGTAKVICGKITRTIVPSLDPHSYLKEVSGVIHVGANLGQERELYAKYKLKVLWIEPLPDIFEQLCKNIEPFPDQKAVNHLITDKDNVEYSLHVANNGGASSSILELGRHTEIWPDIHYVSKVLLKSITLELSVKRPGHRQVVLSSSGHRYSGL